MDALRRTRRIGGQTEWLTQALGSDSLVHQSAGEAHWPESQVVLVGPQLASALRPFARDLAGHLAPPGSDDLTLEAAAEMLLTEDPRLTDERLEQEARCGIEFKAEGYLHFEAGRLDKQALASCVRTRWITRKAPQSIIAFPELDAAQVNTAHCDWLIIHDPEAPARLPSALKCPHTQRFLPLAGVDTARLVDRTHEQSYQLWAWLEPIIEQGGKVLIGPDRDQLLTTWAKAWF